MSPNRRWLLLLAAAAPLLAEVRLPAVISDHMLLQQGVPVRIWGRAEPGEAVRVEVAGQRVAAEADASGRWSAYLKPLAAGGPHEMTITGRNKIVIRDVLVGEVWVGSGQSNMQWTVARS
ncbi:MAG: sialate O-acetylesterase, partial [Acidobacteria bacterium]|nr:sialate O-acetylesterase [Acidobacteriota bacterium]